MSGMLEKAVIALTIVMGAICAWAVLTPNHLFVG
ncbi:hypothetical protein LMG8286_00118 [Campylobacter suis]|uniref:Uncharacterized protein n=1 Tax=Campylobacter suis TaxID=2790657 RepID=A0ABN7K1D8_9BACT|nr:hypothetical protein LMG8286_00118 [Campylobacter suis]